MAQEYGMRKCPYNDPELVDRIRRENGFGDDSGLCYDLDHFGNIACGLCGSNRERAQSAQENFLRGVEREMWKWDEVEYDDLNLKNFLTEEEAEAEKRLKGDRI